MDINFIKESLPLYAEAAALTLGIAAVGIAGAFITGMICSMIRYLKIPILKGIAAGYIELSRNTPLLIQLFFLYFGLPKAGILLSSKQCAVIGLIFQGGSYMAEAFRSGLESVADIQKETGLALGMNEKQVLKYIILPQAFSTSVPALCANMIFLLKETSVFSAVALADLVFVTKDLIGIYYKTDEALGLLALAYLVLLLPISLLGSVLERKVRYAGFGNTGTISGK